jgi:hypothetical protein
LNAVPSITDKLNNVKFSPANDIFHNNSYLLDVNTINTPKTAQFISNSMGAFDPSQVTFKDERFNVKFDRKFVIAITGSVR